MQKNREPRGPVHKERNKYIWTNRKYQPIKMTKTHQPFPRKKSSDMMRYQGIRKPPQNGRDGRPETLKDETVPPFPDEPNGGRKDRAEINALFSPATDSLLDRSKTTVRKRKGDGQFIPYMLSLRTLKEQMSICLMIR